MPDAKDNAKQTGDVHPPLHNAAPNLPDAAPDLDGTPRDADRAQANDMARERQEEARPGKGENQAGFLKDNDSPGRGA